jgi:basic membrane protein A
MDITTFNAIEAVLNGTFEGGVTVGTLTNGGVGLAEFHEMDAMVSDELKAEIDTVRQGVIDGTISVTGG